MWVVQQELNLKGGLRTGTSVDLIPKMELCKKACVCVQRSPEGVSSGAFDIQAPLFLSSTVNVPSPWMCTFVRFVQILWAEKLRNSQLKIRDVVDVGTKQAESVYRAQAPTSVFCAPLKPILLLKCPCPPFGRFHSRGGFSLKNDGGACSPTALSVPFPPSRT